MRSGLVDVLEPVLAEIALAHAFGQRRPTSAAVAADRSTWPPWPAAQIRAARTTSIPT